MQALALGRRRVRALLLAATAAALCLIFSTSAQAAWWTATMTYNGSACWGIQSSTVTIRADTGEAHASNASGWSPGYSMTFGNIPGSGVWATAWVRCSVTGTYSRRVWLPRPWHSASATVNLR